MLDEDKYRKRMVVMRHGLDGYCWLDYIWHRNAYRVSAQATLVGEDGVKTKRWLEPLRDFTYDFRRGVFKLTDHSGLPVGTPIDITTSGSHLGDPRKLRRGMQRDIHRRNKRPARFGILNKPLKKTGRSLRSR